MESKRINYLHATAKDVEMLASVTALRAMIATTLAAPPSRFRDFALEYLYAELAKAERRLKEANPGAGR